MQDNVRKAAISGSFYPSDPADLAKEIDAMLMNARMDGTQKDIPKILIAPHAGHRYSGGCAAKAYDKWRDSGINRVVMLGPAHRKAVQGVATSSKAYWQTPLGNVYLDRQAIKMLEALPFVVCDDAAHAQEHCLEVHLPFLQRLLRNFTLLPLAVGMCETQKLRHIIESLWGDEKTGILISTDLSHFHPYDICNQLDEKTAKAVDQFQWTDIGREQACGRIPLSGVLSMPLLSTDEHINAENFQIERIDLINSGDTAGDKSRVVGYGAWAVYDKMPNQEQIGQEQISQEQKAGRHHAPKKQDYRQNQLLDLQLVDGHGQALLHLAHQALHMAVIERKQVSARHEHLSDSLLQPRAVFITLEKNLRLRGCIGSLQASRPLVDDICANSYAAALKDHRFQPVQAGELKTIQLSISLLGTPEPMEFEDETDLLSQLRPNMDGLIIEDRGRRATYLPQVWQQIPDRKAFLNSLKQKAGLPQDHWSNHMKVQRYGATKIG